jgi:hypothetical protein
VTLITFLLAREYKLHGPSLESGVKCEHKYWSRSLQAEVARKHVPGFALVNPYQTEKIEDIDLAPSLKKKTISKSWK